MNFYDALNIFNLNSNYTEEELNKKYYALAKQYHPDALTNKSTEEQAAAAEQFKKINEAKDILSKALKERNSFQSGPNYSNYTSSQSEASKSALNFIEKNRNASYEVRGQFAGDIYKFHIFVTKYITYVTNAESISLVDNLFLDYKKELKDFYHKFKNIYFNRHLIPENFDFEIDNSDINLSLNEFYEKLKQIKKESIKNIYVKEIDDIISPYKSNIYYEDLKDEIEKLKNETINNILDIDLNLYDYKTEEKYYLDKLKKDIAILFKRISINKPLYLNLLNLVKENSLSFLNLRKIENLITDYLFPLYYQDLLDEIKHYLELIACYDEADKIRNNLANKYYDALICSNDPYYKAQITKLYHKIKDFLNKDLKISLESLSLLNYIDFNNYEEAVRIFDKVTNNLITLKNVEIYIGNLTSTGTPAIYIKIDNEEYKLMQINNETVVYDYANIDDPKISLDTFMDNAQVFFIKFVYDNEEIVGLYRFNNIILGLRNGHLEFFSNIEIADIDIPEKSAGKYSNKDYVKSLLINNYYQYIELCKKENKILNLNNSENGFYKWTFKKH